MIDESNASVEALRLAADTLTDVFTYTVVDAGGLVDSTHVTITIRGANDTPGSIAATALWVNENSSNGTWVGQLFMQDVDVSDTATYSLDSDADGRFEIDAVSGVLRVKDGTWLDFEDSAVQYVVVRATDMEGLSIDYLFEVQILNVNEKPIGGADRYETTYIDRVIVGGTGVMGNDMDSEGDALTARLISGPSLGVLTFNSDGSFMYQPDGAYVGTVTFVYELNDGLLGSDLVTVEIAIGLPKTMPGTTQSSTSSSSASIVESNPNQVSLNSAKSSVVSSSSSAVHGTSAPSGTVARSSETVGLANGVGVVDVSVAAMVVGDTSAVGGEGGTKEEANKALAGGRVLYGALGVTNVFMWSEESRNDLTQVDKRLARSEWNDRERLGIELGMNRANVDERRRNDAGGTIELSTTAVVQTVLGTGVVLWLAQGFHVAATMVTAAPVWSGLDPIALTMGMAAKTEKEVLTVEEKMFDK